MPLCTRPPSGRWSCINMSKIAQTALDLSRLLPKGRKNAEPSLLELCWGAADFRGEASKSTCNYQVSECKCTDKKIPDYAKKARRESIGEEKKNIGKESGKNPIIFLSYDVCLRIVCLRLYACPTRFCRHREKSSLGIFLASCRSSFWCSTLMADYRAPSFARM